MDMIADFDDYFVMVTDLGAVRAGVKGVMSKDFQPNTDTYTALIKGAEAATCDDDLEDLFFELGI